MGRKVKYSSKEKINAVKEYLDGKDSINSIAKRLDITFQAFKQWVNNYEAMGADAFMTCHNKHYSKAEKEQAVAAYLAGEGSHMDICKKYKIHSTTQLRRWIKKYNSNIELKDYKSKWEVYMAKGRKTSKEERVEIVKYCINNERNYKEAADKYKVSYNQVYTWVKKYDSNGDAGLIDKRGHHKKDDEVDELERLRRDNNRLKRQLEEKDMVVELLKKVQEIEGRRY